MIVKVFLLGRPGSGKTTAFQYIEMLAHDRGQQAIRFREYAHLYTMFQAGRKEFQAVEHGGFDIIDFSILNESAHLLEKEVQEHILSLGQKDMFLFLEIARKEYQQTMHCFSPSFLQNSYFLFVEADIEICIERIHYRVAHQNAETDHHFVSDHILKTYYAQSNAQYMETLFKRDYGIQKEVTVIENMGSSKMYREKLNAFADTLFAELALARI